MTTKLLMEFLEEGKEIDFADFVIQTAASYFPPLYDRERPWGKPIPEKIVIDDTVLEDFKTAEEELKRLRNLSLREIENNLETIYQISLKRYQEEAKQFEKERQEWLSRERMYGLVMREVKKWKPPTNRHRELKRFMVGQLRNKLLECKGHLNEYYRPQPPQKESVSAHKKRMIAYQKNEIARLQKKIRKIEKDNKWLQDLRSSLPKPQRVPPS